MIQRFLISVIRLKAGLGSRCRNYMFRALGCHLEGYVWMRRIKVPRNWSAIRIGSGTALDEGITLLVSGDGVGIKIDIGRSVYINQNTFIDASETIYIGNETMIGPGCYITDHDHHVEAGKSPGEGRLINKPTRIGNRVWLGAHVTVLKGVTIGDGAIIGAGSVVTKDVPQNYLAVGNPARVLREV
jgi:acetyltransferase-like isoleucine patch superfamily enzyme